MSSHSAPFDRQAILNLDPWLEPFIPSIENRYSIYQRWKDNIFSNEGGYDAFSRGFDRFGLNVDDNGQITYREWAPNAKEAVLIGDFSTRFSAQPPRLQLLIHNFHSFHTAYTLPNHVWRVVFHRRMEQDHSSNDQESVRRVGDNSPSHSRRTASYSARLQNQGVSSMPQLPLLDCHGQKLSGFVQDIPDSSAR
jgi:hypothetical protein